MWKQQQVGGSRWHHLQLQLQLQLQHQLPHQQQLQYPTQSQRMPATLALIESLCHRKSGSLRRLPGMTRTWPGAG